MLCHLSISNFATVTTLDIDFQSGMSVITGETGAGKSIILGALGLALGDRADRGVIRDGSGKTEICAEFDLSHKPEARDWLNEQDLGSPETDNQICLFRRVVSSDGRSRAFINGVNVTLANLKTLGEMLIDIHSQHEHQSLLHRATHRKLLDGFGGHQKLAAEVAGLHQQWQNTQNQITTLSEQSQESSAQTQLLSYQLNELNELALAEDELTKLDEEFKRLNEADDSIASFEQALALCADTDAQSDGGSLLHGLQQAQAVLGALSHRSARIENALSLLNTAGIQLEEAVAELRLEVDQFEANPERLEQVNHRLADIHSVARKHRIRPEDISALTLDLQSQLDALINCDEALAELQELQQSLLVDYQSAAKKLTQKRQAAAKKISKSVNEQLKTLGMADARLEVSLTSHADQQPQSGGQEVVEFLVSTNPGQAAKPLIKVASGGELSRISLAIQVITAQTTSTSCLVFDEVDVGIGGKVAKAVGELLRQLGERAQILCVTHQAQVAGQGNHHFVVSKSSNGEGTQTRIDSLNHDQRVEEIARMLGGEMVEGESKNAEVGEQAQLFSEESLAHAKQMMAAE